MLVQNSVYRNTYLTDGVNKDFYFSFPILESSQVLVQTSAVTDTETVTTVDPSQYTVTGVGLTTGGHISFNTAPPTGSRIALTLNIPITQLYQYAELDSFPAKSHEDALAKLTLICQQLKEQISRAVLISATSESSTADFIASLYAARDSAAAGAVSAAAEADAAAASALTAAGSAISAAQAAAAAAAFTPGGIVPVIEKWRFVVGEFYYFRHPTMRPGFAAAQGGLISGVYQGKNITEYPIWDYLQTAEGQLLCKTEAEWQAMTTATWATLADGSKVGWDGIGGAPFYVQDLGAGTLRMPDLRGMYAEAAGYDSLGVGGVHGDMMRKVVGAFRRRYGSVAATGAFVDTLSEQENLAGGPSNMLSYYTTLDISRVVPTGSANKTRGWGALACCYLGTPAS